jgi:hypothetical protein
MALLYRGSLSVSKPIECAALPRFKMTHDENVLRPTTLFLQPWWFQMVAGATTAIPVCVTLSIAISRKTGSGWMHLFEGLWPFIIVQPIMCLGFRHWFNERFYSRKQPISKSSGLWLKIGAIVLSIIAIMTGILATENPKISVWAPGGELWLVVSMVVVFWVWAVLAYLTGDSIIRFVRSNSKTL